jgi:hypothetical protein
MLVAIYHNHTPGRDKTYQGGDIVQLVHVACYGFIAPDWTGDSEPRLNLPVRRSWPLTPGLPRRICEAVARILGGSWCGEAEREILARYQARGIRKPESGDVFIVDPYGPYRTTLARYFSGWSTVTGPLHTIAHQGVTS